MVDGSKHPSGAGKSGRQSLDQAEHLATLAADGSTPDECRSALFAIGLSMGAVLASDKDLKGQIVVVAMLPDDADYFGNGVATALRNDGADVRIACLWVDQVNSPSEQGRSLSRVSSEFVDLEGESVDRLVIASSVIDDDRVVDAMVSRLRARTSSAEIHILSPLPLNGYPARAELRSKLVTTGSVTMPKIVVERIAAFENPVLLELEETTQKRSLVSAIEEAVKENEGVLAWDSRIETELFARDAAVLRKILRRIDAVPIEELLAQNVSEPRASATVELDDLVASGIEDSEIPEQYRWNSDDSDVTDERRGVGHKGDL